MTASGAQDLLRCPQCITAPGGAQDHQISEVHTRGSQRGRIGQVRRRKPGHALLALRERSKCGQHELQLAEAFLAGKDLGQRTNRPAATRQLAIEFGVAGGNSIRAGSTE